MVLFAKGSYRADSRKAKTGRVLIPAKLVNDSAFPLEEGEVNIVIYKNKIVIKNVIKRDNGIEVRESPEDFLADNWGGN